MIFSRKSSVSVGSSGAIPDGDSFCLIFQFKINFIWSNFLSCSDTPLEENVSLWKNWLRFLEISSHTFFGVLVTILLTSGCSSCVWLWLISINFLFMFPRSATFLCVLSMLKRQNKMYVQLFIHTNKHTKLAFYNSGNNIMKQGDILVWVWFATSKARLNFNLSHGLPDNLRLKNIRNWEIFQKPQSRLEAELSAQSL